MSPLLLMALATAAPPNVTFLAPAGGQRGTTVEVTPGGAVGAFTVWTDDPAVTAVADKGKLRVTIAADARPGVHWLRLSNADGPGNLRPFVVGLLPEFAEIEPNDSASQHQRIASPACVVNGTLAKPGDTDCFAVNAKKGQTLVAALQAHRGIGSPMDGVLQILSADGFVLAQNHDHDGLDPRVVFTVPTDGVYVVRLFAFPSAPDTQIRLAGAETYVYRLTLTTAGYADFTMPLFVRRGEPGKVAVDGWNLTDDAKSLDVPKSDDDVATLVHPKIGNTLRVRVVADPFAFTGRLLKPGEPAVVAFPAKKGQPLRVVVESRSLGLELTPIVRVLDAAGKELVRAEGATPDADPIATLTPPADGEYRAEVSDLFRHAGPRFTFLLRIAPPVPDFTLSTAADRFVVPVGKPLEVPITVTPSDGFKDAIEVTAEGLPEGVAVETLKSDAKTITLKFTASKPNVGGPFRLVGKSKGGIVRPATFKLTEFDSTVPYLWIRSSP